MIEERLVQPLSTTVHPTNLHNVVREVVQEMWTLQRDVVADVTTQVTSNIDTDIAEHLSDITTQPPPDSQV